MVLGNWKLVLNILDSGVVAVIVGGVFALLVLWLNGKGQFKRDRGSVAKEIWGVYKKGTKEEDKKVEKMIERYNKVYKGLEETFKK